MAAAKTKIFLSGPLQIICDDGRDATPPGTKAKALLALVVLSKNAVRSRAWLQDHLWSTSAPAQGAASLRKELSRLSKFFGAQDLSWFTIARDTVSIDLGAVEVDIFDTDLPPDRAELLEGLDVGDPEFEDWLAIERQAFWSVDTGEGDDTPIPAQRPAHWGRQRPILVLEPMETVGDTADVAITAAAIHDELMFLLGTLSDVIELRDARRQTAPVEGYILSGSVVGADTLRVGAQLTSTADDSCLWNGRFRFRQGDSFDAVEEIAMELVAALQLRLRDGHWADIWSARATSTEAWTEFQRGRVKEGHTTYDGLSTAIRHYEHCLTHDPEYLPAQVAIGFCKLDLIRLGMARDPDSFLSEVQTLSARLRAEHPDDAYCIALEAFTHNVAGHTEEACELMRPVIDRWRNSPELLGYYGTLLGYDGRYEAEIAVCRKALALTPHPPIWIESNLAISMAQVGDKAAWHHAHNVLRNDAGNVRARMVLCALSAEAGNTSLARRHARRILELEPDFTAETWAWAPCFRDPDHHAHMARLLASAGL
ncbi:hypothetical protein KDD17_17550 [Sulfitobacter albidus]|uniref:Uncharacterized protein n=1 Tax=Sulfitobacter albidus TaxID=2829501 RepID=A0A975JH14_9RHOB|nr:hypothetical protein [Sulfitobacter albidus]QUJ78147.1 hypothetical protein KDD17_17550 [Sulfitobacter albidus]